MPGSVQRSRIVRASANSALPAPSPIGQAFDLVIADEAHHCLASEWRTVLDHFTEARVLGVTATPSRSDNRKLGSFFERVACEVTLLDLIRSGYLSPIRALKLPVEVDVSALRRKRGDLAAGDVGGHLLVGKIDPSLQEGKPLEKLVPPSAVTLR